MYFGSQCSQHNMQSESGATFLLPSNEVFQVQIQKSQTVLLVKQHLNETRASVNSSQTFYIENPLTEVCCFLSHFKTIEGCLRKTAWSPCEGSANSLPFSVKYQTFDRTIKYFALVFFGSTIAWYQLSTHTFKCDVRIFIMSCNTLDNEQVSAANEWVFQSFATSD